MSCLFVPVFSGPPSGWGVHRRNDFLFNDMSRATRDEGAVLLFVMVFVFVDSTAGRHCLPHDDSVSTSSRCYGSTSCLPPLTRRGSPSDFVPFLSVLLGLVAVSFFFLGGWVGFPLPRFPLPPPLWLFFPLGGLGPLAVFSRCFPHGSWVGGGLRFCVFVSPAISCVLHLSSLATRTIWSTDPQTPRPPPPFSLARRS